MTPLPETNATLVSISSPGTRKTYGHPAGSDPSPKWHGVAGAYVKERVMTATNTPSGMTRTKVTDLIIPGNLRPSFDLASGDHVTYKIRDKRTQRVSTFTREIADFVAPQAPPGIPTTVKISFTNAPV